eukprot:6378796-Pyramimonas_sp.AAC.1
MHHSQSQLATPCPSTELTGASGRGYILTTDQSDAGSVGIFSRWASQTRNAVGGCWDADLGWPDALSCVTVWHPQVVLYHGPKRGQLDEKELAEADVVLTTYSVVEAEYRKNVLPNKKACQYCGKKYYPQQLKMHLTFWCGESIVFTCYYQMCYFVVLAKPRQSRVDGSCLLYTRCGQYTGCTPPLPSMADKRR